MIIVRERQKIKEGKITWNDFFNRYKKARVARALYYPYMATPVSNASVEVINAVIAIDGYNSLEIKNQTTSIVISAKTIESIEEIQDNRGNVTVDIWTKLKGNLSFEVLY